MGTSQENLVDTFCKEMDKAKEAMESMSSAPIYRVPKALRELNESAYTPRLVSIGPLHSNDGHLNPHMQKIKMSYLESLLNELSKGETKVKKDMLAECVNKMEELIDRAKHYYAEEVDRLDVKMLVTDGCLILEVLRRAYPEETPDSSSSSQVTDGCCFKVLEALRRTCDTEKKPDADQVTEREESSIVDPIFDIPLTCEAVLNDLLLLENQLPFFVLQKLFDCTLGRTSNSPTLRDYVISLFRGILTIGDECTDSNATNCGGWPGDCFLSIDEGNNNNDPTPPKNVDCPPHHILHLIHEYLYYLDDTQSAPKKGSRESTCMPCSASKEGLGLSSSSKDMPSASDLAYKGVKFERCRNLSEVEFETLGPCRGACFRIPTLYVGDSTESILRNLIALEQCCPRFESCFFTSYAYLMDRLINTAKDVEELGGGGLINHSLGNSEEASRFFNNLCKGVTLDLNKDLYSRECKKAVSYSERSMYRVIPATMTHLKCKFRASPWTSVAFFIAFVSFGISLTNFIRSWVKE